MLKMNPHPALHVPSLQVCHISSYFLIYGTIWRSSIHTYTLANSHTPPPTLSSFNIIIPKCIVFCLIILCHYLVKYVHNDGGRLNPPFLPIKVSI